MQVSPSPANRKKEALVVFEMLRPYSKEAATIMATPTGLSLRFRYKRKWFSVDDPKTLVGHDCLIALRVTTTAAVLPLRFGTIREVKAVGEIFYVAVTASSYVELDDIASARQHQLDAFNQRLAEGVLCGVKNDAGSGMAKLLFLSSSFRSIFGNPSYTGEEEVRQVAAWGGLVEQLITYDEFKGLDFLYLIFFDGAASQPRGTSAPRLSFEGGRHHQVSIVQRRGQDGPTKAIRMKVDGKILVPVLDTQLAVGKYDVLEYSFSSEAATDAERLAAIVVEAECQADPAATLFPPLLIPVTVRARSRVRDVAGLLVFIAASAVILFPAMTSAIPASQSQDLKNIAILGAIASSGFAGSIGKTIVGKLFRLS